MTPRTVNYQVGAWRGGQHTTPASVYEFWTIYNNWRFLARHGRWLRRHGLIGSPLLAGTLFMLDRVQRLATTHPYWPFSNRRRT